MSEVIARLKEHQSSTPSKWRERAEWRQQNKSWLLHSQRIAVKMLIRMDELNLTQKQLAELYPFPHLALAYSQLSRREVRH